MIKFGPHFQRSLHQSLFIEFMVIILHTYVKGLIICISIHTKFINSLIITFNLKVCYGKAILGTFRTCM